MQVVNKEVTETVYTLELTEREINTLVAAMGRTNTPQREELAETYGVKVLNMCESQLLYSDLKALFLVK